MSNQHDMCRSFLTASRIVSRRNGGKSDTDRQFGVTHTSDRHYWLVQDAHGKTMYEGQACCAYDARSQALMQEAP